MVEGRRRHESGVDAAQGDVEVRAEGIELRLTRAEALVFFEWLVTVNEGGGLIVDEAERRVLHDLESQLEAKLVEPFQPGYARLVDAAKKTVLGAPISES